MSYDIRLKHTKTDETAVMKHPQLIRGGTVRAMYNEQTGQLEQAKQVEADINVTFNYGKYYNEVTEGDTRFAHDEISAYYANGTNGPIVTYYGIRGLNGKTAKESIQMLTDMIDKISKRYKDKDGNWITTERTKTIYLKDGKEVDALEALIHKKYDEEKQITYTVNEGSNGGSYWERTAANAIRPLLDMVMMATDNLTEDDVVWEVLC